MSSVTRFLRQIPTGMHYVNPSTLTSSALDFVPTSSNYVGNYPPGYVVPAAQTGLSTALTNAGAVGMVAIRDMGKTIFCPYVATVGASLAAAPSGFYREYQLRVVSPITASQGFIGGVGGNTFGGAGPAPSTAPGTSNYATFYLPTVVGGVGPATLSLPVVNVNAGAQM